MAEASAEAGPSAYRWQVGDTARFWAENQGILVAWSPALPHEFCYAGGFPMPLGVFALTAVSWIIFPVTSEKLSVITTLEGACV